MRLIKASSPHIIKGGNKNKVMLMVFLALLPATFAGGYFFGQQAILIILASLISSWATDLGMQYLTKRHTYKINFSSLITGLLLALVLPPTAPLWIPVLGSVFAVSIGK